MKTVHATTLSTSLKLLLGVVLATGVFAAAANAHPSFAAKFNLPYEVHWGQTVLPAGEYSIRMEAASMAKIMSTTGNKAVYTGPPIVLDSEKGSACLTITTQGHERRVRSLNLPSIGKSLVFAPLSKSDREALAKAGQINAVPVIIAKK
jgi:hypothetical protein